MELSFKVLCKIDKYYNQVKFQVLWPRLKVEFSIVMFTAGIFGFSNRFARNHQRRSLFEDQNLLEGSSKSFFAYLPSIAGYIARSSS